MPCCLIYPRPTKSEEGSNEASLMAIRVCSEMMERKPGSSFE